MKPLRFKINFELPLKYENVIWKILAHLQANPTVIGKKEGDIVFTKDIYKFCVDCAMDHLEIDTFDNDVGIEIVDKKDKEWLLQKTADNPEFRKKEYLIAAKMTPEELKDYETNYMRDGISMQEYMVIKEALG